MNISGEIFNPKLNVAASGEYNESCLLVYGTVHSTHTWTMLFQCSSWKGTSSQATGNTLSQLHRLPPAVQVDRWPFVTSSWNDVVGPTRFSLSLPHTPGGHLGEL